MTEKQYAPTKIEKKVSQNKVATSEPKVETKTPVQKTEDKNVDDKKTTKKDEPKKPVQKKVVKKDEVVVNGTSLPISTKYSAAICKFIKGKPIEIAIKELEEVMAFKRAIPVKGEIPHRKGKIMSGRYTTKTTKYFIELLKSLAANANNHEVDEPFVSFAMANLASRPYGKFGRVRRKRSHITLKAKTKSKKSTKKTKSNTNKK